ncbi:hypothetical protein [Nafulsella turpanensis]|uniref:hypothetical protein n=1 Tax=Nafulsella turpanensis TaxID=1265690 RepID=UPI00037629EE|nr:hypothetical protein [Nafulsella turpanensis]
MKRIEDDRGIMYRLTEKDQKRKSLVTRLLIKSIFYLGVSLFFSLPPLVANYYELIPYFFLGSIILFLPSFYYDYKEESRQIIEVDLPKRSDTVTFKILDKENTFYTKIKLTEAKVKLIEMNAGQIKQVPQMVIVESEITKVVQKKSIFWPGKLLKELYHDLKKVKRNYVVSGVESK